MASVHPVHRPRTKHRQDVGVPTTEPHRKAGLRAGSRLAASCRSTGRNRRANREPGGGIRRAANIGGIRGNDPSRIAVRRAFPASVADSAGSVRGVRQPIGTDPTFLHGRAGSAGAACRLRQRRPSGAPDAGRDASPPGPDTGPPTRGKRSRPPAAAGRPRFPAPRGPVPSDRFPPPNPLAGTTAETERRDEATIASKTIASKLSRSAFPPHLTPRPRHLHRPA